MSHNDGTMNHPAAIPDPQPRYVRMATRLADMIAAGTFKHGQRLASVRDTAAHEGVSLSTAMQAFRWLEDKGLVQAKPKAGYFVHAPRYRAALPQVGQPPAASLPVLQRSRTDVIRLEGQPAVQVNLGGDLSA